MKFIGNLVLITIFLSQAMAAPPNLFSGLSELPRTTPYLPKENHDMQPDIENGLFKDQEIPQRFCTDKKGKSLLQCLRDAVIDQGRPVKDMRAPISQGDPFNVEEPATKSKWNEGRKKPVERGRLQYLFDRK
jgi:hypothetical protein